jgi:hypothetical protein
MQLGLREWWSAKSGAEKIVWVIAILSIILYLTGNLDGVNLRDE